MAERTPDGNRRRLWAGRPIRGLRSCRGGPTTFKWKRGNMMMNRSLHVLTLAVAACGAALLTPTVAAPRSADFNGNWSVLVITKSGTCDPAYRYGVTVENGAVRYRGESGVDVSGNVDERGRVRVTIGRGEQSAEGTGRLTGDGGSGTWNGRSPDSRCSGVWEAERR